jgi:hypothetical protein
VHADRREYGKQLFIKSSEIEAEKLFRILLLAILKTIGQHKSVTVRRYVARKRANRILSCLFSFIASYK